MAAPVAYRTARPVRRMLLVLGSLLVLAMVGWGALSILDRLSIQSEQTLRAYAGVDVVDLRSAHGEVELVPADGPRVRVAVDAEHGFLAGHERTVEQLGGELRLRGRCDFLTLGSCREDYRIELPRGTAVRVENSAGEVFATGLRGDLEVRSSAGEVTADDIRGAHVSLRSSAGSISATDIRADELTVRSSAGGVTVERSVGGRVEARTSAGAVEVELLEPPTSLEARSSAGYVEAVVPDVGYDVSADTSAGDEEVAVRQQPGSPRTIEIHSSAGHVRVLPLAEVGARGGGDGAASRRDGRAARPGARGGAGARPR